MAKILGQDPDDQTRAHVLKGILIRSLQDAGTRFNEAFEIATEVGNELGAT